MNKSENPGQHSMTRDRTWDVLLSKEPGVCLAVQNHVEVDVTPPATSSTNNTGHPEPA